MAQSPKNSSGNLGGLDRSGPATKASVVDFDNQTSSEVNIMGESHEVFLIDKSKRAFDISLDSTKAFELSLQKSRSGFKYSFIRYRAMWYSLWLAMLKHHGKPPGQAGLSWLFFGFASFVTLDLLLNVIIYAHLFSPIGNMWT